MKYRTKLAIIASVAGFGILLPIVGASLLIAGKFREGHYVNRHSYVINQLRLDVLEPRNNNETPIDMKACLDSDTSFMYDFKNEEDYTHYIKKLNSYLLSEDKFIFVGSYIEQTSKGSVLLENGFDTVEEAFEVCVISDRKQSLGSSYSATLLTFKPKNEDDIGYSISCYATPLVNVKVLNEIADVKKEIIDTSNVKNYLRPGIDTSYFLYQTPNHFVQRINMTLKVDGFNADDQAVSVDNIKLSSKLSKNRTGGRFYLSNFSIDGTFKTISSYTVNQLTNSFGCTYEFKK